MTNLYNNAAKAGTENIAKDFDKSSLSAKKLADDIKKAMAALVVDGKKGTQEFKLLEQEFKKASTEAAKFDKALNDIDKKVNVDVNVKSSGLDAFAAVQNIGTVATELQSLSSGVIALDTATQSMKALGGEAVALAPILEEVSIKMSKDLPASAGDLQNAFTQAIASGVKGGAAELEGFVETMAKLSVGGGASLEATTKGVGGLLNAFGDDAGKANEYADILFNTINEGVISMDEINSYFSQASSSAKSAGLSVADLGAGMAILTQKGIPAAQASTRLNALFNELQKPASTLVPILEKAGVSLDSIKANGAASEFEKLRDAIAASGGTATQFFGSSEAASAFDNITSKAGEFGDMLEKIEGTTGSAQFAYDQMADSIAVKNQMLTNRIQTFITEGIRPISGAFTSVTGAIANNAGLLQAGVALRGLVPEGSVAKIKDFATSITSKLVPSIAAQTTATGSATVAQGGLNAVLAANPVGAVVLGLVALVAILKVTSALLTETTEEKLASAKADEEILRSQLKQSEATEKAEANSLKQISSYKKLSEERKALSEQEKNLAAGSKEAADLKAKQVALDEKISASASKLAGSYVGISTETQNYANNLKILDAEAEKAKNKILDLTSEQIKLTQNLANNAKVQLNLEVALEKEKLDASLAEAFDDNFFESYKGAFTDAFDAVGELLQGNLSNAATLAFESIKNIANSALLGFGGEISEFIFGTSDAKKLGENMTQNFGAAISKATTSSQVQKASADMKQQILNSTTLSKEDQAKAIKSIEATEAKKLDAIKKSAEGALKVRESAGQQVSQALSEIASAGGTADEALTKIAKNVKGLNKTELRDLAIAESFSKINFNSKGASKEVEKLAKQFGLTPEQVRKIAAEQGKVTKELKESVGEAQNLGEAFNEALDVQKKKMNGLVSEYAANLALQQKGTEEQKKEATARLAAIKNEFEALKSSVKGNEAFTESAKKALGASESDTKAKQKAAKATKEAAAEGKALVQNFKETEDNILRLSKLYPELTAEQEAALTVDQRAVREGNKKAFEQQASLLSEAQRERLQAFRIIQAKEQEISTLELIKDTEERARRENRVNQEISEQKAKIALDSQRRVNELLNSEALKGEAKTIEQINKMSEGAEKERALAVFKLRSELIDLLTKNTEDLNKTVVDSEIRKNKQLSEEEKKRLDELKKTIAGSQKILDTAKIDFEQKVGDGLNRITQLLSTETAATIEEVMSLSAEEIDKRIEETRQKIESLSKIDATPEDLIRREELVRLDDILTSVKQLQFASTEVDTLINKYQEALKVIQEDKDAFKIDPEGTQAYIVKLQGVIQQLKETRQEAKETNFAIRNFGKSDQVTLLSSSLKGLANSLVSLRSGFDVQELIQWRKELTKTTEESEDAADKIRKSFAKGLINSQELQSELNALFKTQKEQTKDFTFFWQQESVKLGSAFSQQGAKDFANMTAALKKMTKDGTKNMDILGAASVQFSLAFGNSFAGAMLQGANAMDAFILALLDTLDAAIPALTAMITGVNLANIQNLTNPSWGLVASIAAVATLKGLVATAKAAYKGNRGFATGGYVDGGRQEITINEKGQEFVINANATKKYRPVLEYINKNNSLPMVRDTKTDEILQDLATQVGVLAESIGTVNEKVSRVNFEMNDAKISGRDLVMTFKKNKKIQQARG